MNYFDVRISGFGILPGFTSDCAGVPVAAPSSCRCHRCGLCVSGSGCRLCVSHCGAVLVTVTEVSVAVTVDMVVVSVTLVAVWVVVVVVLQQGLAQATSHPLTMPC